MLPDRLTNAAVLAAAANLVVIALLGWYDVRLGPLHLAAGSFFKPLLYLNGAFLLAIAARRGKSGPAPVFPSNQAVRPGGHPLDARFLILAAGLTAALYAVSFTINLSYPDWTHRNITGGRGPMSFFTQPQYDGFYRPLAYLSLWLDNRVFGDRLSGYHAQSVILQLVNGLLVTRLAARIGLSTAWARLAGLAFLALPAGFEAVIWPGARFDLLATAFTLLAVERVLAGRAAVATLLFTAGVLSKESAYCYPLILGALLVFRKPLELPVSRERMVRALSAAAAVTAILIGVRFLVYGGFGGYPSPQPGRSVHFLFTAGTVTSLFTRVPAALYLVNSLADLSLWMRAALMIYAGLVVAAVLAGARLGARRVLILFPLLAAVPTLNMIAWVNPAAQQGRYLYQPGVWAILALCFALSPLPRGQLLAWLTISVMGAAALFNTLAYTSMLRDARADAASAAGECRNASCCGLILQNLPRDLHGAFYFGHQVRSLAAASLPGIEIGEGETVSPSPCALRLQWAAPRGWRR